MLNASVGVQRAIGRLRRPPSPRASTTTVAVSPLATLHLQRRVRSYGRALLRLSHIDSFGQTWDGAHPVRQARSSLIARLGHDRTVAMAAALIVVSASVISVSASKPAPATGGTTGPGLDVRIAVGGLAASSRVGNVAEADPPNLGALEAIGSVDSLRSDVAEIPDEVLAAMEAAPNGTATAPKLAGVAGPYLDDGTLLKPVAVDTTVADGRELMETYKVKSGDTLTGIADKFGVSMMTLWWANNLKSKDDLHLGQTLTIPPVTGLVLTVKASDTLASIAGKYKVKEQEILDANKLTDPNLVVGQVLAIPGAVGEEIPAPKTKAGGGSSGNRGGSSRAPITYNGGAFRWPVSGGGNYISQYFHYGHYGLDIAADYGSPVRSAASGTVIFAGWKGNGGGYQVWVAHGSSLYTTYNHLSAISVGSGQHVGEGQQVGRVGSSGHATGPHLHFEVWRGSIWNGGTRVNPLAFL